MFRIALTASFCLVLIGAPLLGAQSKQADRTKANAAEKVSGDWTSYDRDYIGDRYSPLTEISTDNVSRLQRICTYDSGAKTSFETGPVVVNGTLYFTTLDTTLAINPETCKLRWKHAEPLTQAQRAGLGVNREWQSQMTRCFADTMMAKSSR